MLIIFIYGNINLAESTISSPVQGVTPIAGSDSVTTTFRADTGVYFSNPVDGGGRIHVYPYSQGKELEINMDGKFGVWYLDNLSEY